MLLATYTPPTVHPNAAGTAVAGAAIAGLTWFRFVGTATTRLWKV
jgi:hypothetical protein